MSKPCGRCGEDMYEKDSPRYGPYLRCGRCGLERVPPGGRNEHIKQLLRQGTSTYEIARMTGLTPSRIQQIQMEA